MCRYLRRIVAAALLVAVSSATLAGVVRDQIGNPGVQTGGHALPSHEAPRVPHSLIGAIAQYAAWPWAWLSIVSPFPVNPFFPFHFSSFAHLAPFHRFVPSHGFGKFAPQHKQPTRHFDLPSD